MSLSGNLSFVPLEEVLRLLSRANQRGMLEVRGEGVAGRVYFDLGGVTLATTLPDDELSARIRRSEAAEGEAMAALLREMAVEAIYQLSARGRTFEVFEGRMPVVAAPTPFDLEELLTDSRRRFEEWAEIGTVVTDMDALLRLQRDLGDRDRVTIDRDSWRLISQIGAGASVKDLAREIGTTDFWAARVAAGLIGESLLRLETAATAHAESSSTKTWVTEPEAPAADQTSTYEPVFASSGESLPVEEVYATEPASPSEEPVFADEPAEPAGAFAMEAAEPAYEPEAGQATHAEATYAEATQAGAAGEAPQAEAAGGEAASTTVDPNVSWWVEPEDSAPAAEEDEEEDAQVVEDTEEFLEKVFSGLGAGSEPQHKEEGFGLLRRRRLGVRDFSNEG